MTTTATKLRRSPAPAALPARTRPAPAASSVHRILWGAPRIQRQPDPRRDPARFDTVHQNLFVNAPTTTGAARKPWVAGTTDVLIRDEFRDSVLKEVEGRPAGTFGSTANVLTTQQDAETAALAADTDLHAKYPQIAGQLSPAQIRQRVTVFAPDFEPQNAPDPSFVTNWIENQLPKRTAIGDFALGPSDPDYQKLVQDLATDSALFPTAGILAAVRQFATAAGASAPDIQQAVADVQKEINKKPWSWLFNRKASRMGAFEVQGQVFLSTRTKPAARRPTLIHELLHAYEDADYRRWADSTTSPRLFVEGFTEILTREALTAAELADRTSYEGAVDLLNAKVMPFIPVDDLARAFFRGEVWRIEGKSQVAQEMFEKQVGLAAGATRAEEVARSLSGPGIVQVVEPGAFYRLLNFGTDSSAPKPEHETFLRDVILPMAKADATLRLRFEGHADETGPAGHNKTLSRARARAVYRLAEQLGIPRSQLLGVAAPAGAGEKEPTAGNTSVHGRAMNRRVEIFLTHQP